MSILDILTRRNKSHHYVRTFQVDVNIRMQHIHLLYIIYSHSFMPYQPFPVNSLTLLVT